MNDDTPNPPPGAPVTEADLHAYVDHQLGAVRAAEVEQYLGRRPDERERVDAWRAQNGLLHGLLDPVLDEPVPAALRRPAQAIVAAPIERTWPWRALAAGVALALLGGGTGWVARGALEAEAARRAVALRGGSDLSGFARRAAIAHVVYSPDARRPVEVGADQQQALVTWLTKRLGAPVRAPLLEALGYELIGGRLLPGEKGPVAQFMYGRREDGAGSGQRLTLYVTREVAGQDAAFRFGHDGAVNVFYWVDDRFGYAISAGADRDELMKVSQEVYRQLAPASTARRE